MKRSNCTKPTAFHQLELSRLTLQRRLSSPPVFHQPGCAGKAEGAARAPSPAPGHLTPSGHRDSSPASSPPRNPRPADNRDRSPHGLAAAPHVPPRRRGKAEPGGPSTSPPRGGERGSGAASLTLRPAGAGRRPSGSRARSTTAPSSSPSHPARRRLLAAGARRQLAPRAPSNRPCAARADQRPRHQRPRGRMKGGGQTKSGAAPAAVTEWAASEGSALAASWPRPLRRGGCRMPRARPAPSRALGEERAEGVPSLTAPGVGLKPRNAAQRNGASRQTWEC